MMPKMVEDLLACWCGIWGNRLIAKCGRWCSYASCDVFQMRGPEDVSITKNALWGDLRFIFPNIVSLAKAIVLKEVHELYAYLFVHRM